MDLRAFGGSALTDDVSVPKDRTQEERAGGVPVTYVPARNTIFLSLALAYAETLEAQRIYFGANVLDYSGYPDCRPDFIRAFEVVARLGTKMGIEGRAVEVCAPLLMLSKAEIVQRGQELRAPLELTHSCYAVSYTHLDVYKRQLEEFLSDLKKGPVGSRVTQVQVEWSRATGQSQDFTIK